ncbi:hypothetical protein KQI42_20495 [Tissierella sp. MSJ-40]|uniref:Cyclic lactone autoinducer peptide n=1 Tax=Tissierella simiarum TaxID=2841534 RepID=A0ABS6EDS1_9FIRM|nr:hypothetical protein [Tissierella simiarum]MBU5440379.1 hypothetical protein [Tissierella simiarum]
MKVKKTLVGFISLALVLVNLNLGITTFVHSGDPIMPCTTVYSTLKR